MKICFLAASNSIHSLRWIQYFHEAGHQVTWISLSETIFDIPDGIDFHGLNSHGAGGLLKAALKARQIITRLNPDILHVHYVGSYGVIGLFSGVENIVATPWGSDVIEGKLNPIKKVFITRILRKAKLITCDAWHMRDEVLALGVLEKNIHIINFGIDAARFSNRPANQDIRKTFGLETEPSVVSLRSFEPVYDVETLIRAVPKVLADLPATKFILIGKGTLEKDLKSLAKELGVAESINFAGFIDNQLLPDMLCSVDVYVSTSLSDAGIAASTAEAMACELPVVVTDSGENDRWITDGQNGFLVPVTDPDKLAERLLDMLKDEKLRKKLGQAGRLTIKENNDYQVEMAKMDALYKKIGSKM